MLFTDHIDFLPFIAESAKYRTYKFEYKDDYVDAINFINEHKITFVFNKNNKIVIGMLK